jgi:hypothetical protein
MTERINSYPQVYNLGHRAIINLFDGEVVVQEKVDGSQFSFYKDDNGIVHCRSKNQQIHEGSPAMFQEMWHWLQDNADKIVLNWVYRCEYMSKPKHNVLAYDRIPLNHLYLFDVCYGNENYASHDEIVALAKLLGIDVAYQFYKGTVTSMAQLEGFLETESILGGPTVEGIVIKNYNQFTPEKKIAIGKWVRDDFKEKHKHEWKSNPNKDFVEALAAQYATENRWRKAVQHLSDAGELEFSMRDMPKLIREVQDDIERECIDEIGRELYSHFSNSMRKRYIRGLPEFWKDNLKEKIVLFSE